MNKDDGNVNNFSPDPNNTVIHHFFANILRTESPSKNLMIALLSFFTTT